MPRAPFQILVYLYRRDAQGDLAFALFERADAHFWQGIAGGGEDDETPLQAAMRETREEAGLDLIDGWLALDTIASIPVTAFGDSSLWGETVYVIPQYSFGIHAGAGEIRLSWEHSACAWLPYNEALARLHFDSDRTALWELNQKLQGKGPREA
jgi:dATP pyrophosphohydrolase